jgi:hypothetical protein
MRYDSAVGTAYSQRIPHTVCPAFAGLFFWEATRYCCCWYASDPNPFLPSLAKSARTTLAPHTPASSKVNVPFYAEFLLYRP